MKACDDTRAGSSTDAEGQGAGEGAGEGAEEWGWGGGRRGGLPALEAHTA